MRHAVATRRGRNVRLREYLTFYMFISPWFIVFMTMTLIPLLWGLYLSFTNYSGFNFDNLKWVGFYNYVRVFTDNDAMYALGRSLIITVINVPLGTLVGYLLALLMNNNLKGLYFYRTIIYLPAIIPIVATGLMWKVIFNQHSGLINSFLSLFGLPKVNWLGYEMATTSLIIMLLWGAGSGLIIYLAALKGISRDLYEAAAIDGAGAFSRFLHITTPLMTPVLFFNVIMSIIHSLQILAEPVLLAPDTAANVSAGLMATPIRPNYVYLVHAMQQIFIYQRFSYGLALLWIMFLMILVLSLVVFRSSKYWVHYEVDQGGDRRG
jgi:ABC-type sugar transport system permease subunit